MNSNTEEEIVKSFGRKRIKSRGFATPNQETMAQNLIQKATAGMSMREFRQKSNAIKGRFASNPRTKFTSQEAASQDLLKRAKEQEMPMRNFKREVSRIERSHVNSPEMVEEIIGERELNARKNPTGGSDGTVYRDTRQRAFATDRYKTFKTSEDKKYGIMADHSKGRSSASQLRMERNSILNTVKDSKGKGKLGYILGALTAGAVGLGVVAMVTGSSAGVDKSAEERYRKQQEMETLRRR